MAVSGVFAADFASFYDACQKAEVHLKSFETGAGKVETSLNRMVDNFSGRKIITEATLMAEAIERGGGVSKLTAAQLELAGNKAAEAAEKMRALGLDVPERIQKIADAAAKAGKETSVFDASFAKLTAGFAAGALIERSVSALVGWGSAALAAASETVNLSSKTGLSTTTIQQMAHVADQTGTTLDAFANSAMKLGVNIDGGKGSTRAAVAALGLSFDELRSMSPDQQFDAITAALRDMENPQERNRIGIELFGKAFSEIAPAVVAGYKQMAAEARIAGDHQVRAVDAAGNAWSKFKTDVGSAIVTVGGNIVLLAQHMAYFQLKALGADAELIVFGDQAKAAGSAVQSTTGAFVDYTAELAKAEAELSQLNAEQRAGVEAAKRLGVSEEEITAQFALSAAAQKLLTEQTTEKKKVDSEAEAASKKHAAALGELKFAGGGWRTTLADLNSQVRDSIEGYLKAGVSQGSLAEAYRLTAQQVKAVALSLEDEKRAQEASNRVAALTADLMADIARTRVEMSGTTTDKEIASINRWELEVRQAAERAGGATEEFTEKFQARSAQLREAATYDWQSLGKVSRAELEDTAERARITYEKAAMAGGQYSHGTVAKLKEDYFAAREAARNFGLEAVNSFDQAAEAGLKPIGVFDILTESVAATTARAKGLTEQLEKLQTFSMSIQPMTQTELGHLQSSNSMFHERQQNPDIGLWRKLAQLEGLEGTYAPKSADQYHNMVKDQELLAQLRMWAQGKDRPPGFKDGVEDFAGGLAYVHKDEMLVNLPKGTDVIPAGKAGSGGGHTFVMQISVGGGGTKRDGQRVGRATIDYLRSRGVRLEAR